MTTDPTTPGPIPAWAMEAAQKLFHYRAAHAGKCEAVIRRDEMRRCVADVVEVFTLLNERIEARFNAEHGGPTT